jgi:ribA/ribD-fused uncharacterized protein
MISGFFGEYRWLSNFWPCEITAKDGTKFGSVEAAYQAAKCADADVFKTFARLSPAEAKRKGRSVRIRPDWDIVKVPVMRKLIALKFAPETDLAAKLVATGNRELVEANTWGDRFWGKCGGVGQNKLGVLLMEQREALR